MFQTVLYWYKGTAQAVRALSDPNLLELPVYYVMVVLKAKEHALRKVSEAAEAQSSGNPQFLQYNLVHHAAESI